MIAFEDKDGYVVLVYTPERNSAEWLDSKLDDEGHHRLAWTFTLRKEDLLPLTDDESEDPDTRRFSIGLVEEPYRRIRADVLGTKHDALIDSRIQLAKRHFVAQQNISIFGRIDDLVDEEIIVGGDRDKSIPVEDFLRLLRDFPTTSEMRLYSYFRVSRNLREYMDTMSDAEARLSEYMSRKTILSTVAEERLTAANELEIQKFGFVRDRLEEMLKEAESYSEAKWQNEVADLFLLLYPQYIAVLRNVHIKDQYKRKTALTDRYIDLVLVSAGGHVDVIEIKKPFSDGLMSKRQYRDNHVPVRELSGAIMQAEKYLFHLAKSGPTGERVIADTHKADLPDELEIRITNPRAFILSGRDNNMTDEQKFDFEFVRRKYANMVDIITYDDLLRRIDNVLNALRKREAGPNNE